MNYEDILYREAGGVATITINRPSVYNAFRARTVDELLHAFQQAGWNREIGVIVLTGAGEKAFCTGGDQTSHGDGGYGGRGAIGLPVDELQSLIRDVPKPVIARVNGYAIGGGHVLHVICDMTLASDKAKFGQVGPKVGSVDPGFGTAYLTHVVGEKKAREIWYMCRQYTADQALDMGLVNAVYPHEQLMDQARAWALEIADKSPTAIKLAKQSFNCATEQFRALGNFAMSALALYYDTEEAVEGKNAFMEKRKPNFAKYVK